MSTFSRAHQNANYAGEAAYSSAQWNLGEDFQFDGEDDLSSFTLSNDLVKLEVKPIPSFSKAPYVHPLIIGRVTQTEPSLSLVWTY